MYGNPCCIYSLFSSRWNKWIMKIWFTAWIASNFYADLMFLSILVILLCLFNTFENRTKNKQECCLISHFILLLTGYIIHSVCRGVTHVCEWLYRYGRRKSLLKIKMSSFSMSFYNVQCIVAILSFWNFFPK